MTRAHTIGLMGASGGLGCTVLAVAVAHRAAADGRTALCVDGHPYSGGLEVVAGLEAERGRRWADFARTRGRIDGRAMLAELPGRGAMSVLSFRHLDEEVPDEEAVTAALGGLIREVDLVVIDLPRPGGGGLPGLGEAVDDGVLLVGASPPALAAASAALPHLPAGVDRWWLAQRVERAGDGLADAVAAGLDLPLLVEVPDDPRVDRDLLGGVVPGGRGRLARAAQQLLRVRGERTRSSA